ncbi:MAG: hypothetical protein IJR15_02380 [Clostridiales bacterium]|nr:hypothetical protein [Clostridiales bacterium]
MNTKYKWTNGNDDDFRKFYLKTEEFYSSIVGGLKKREAFVPYNLSDSDVEIKRVWVEPLVTILCARFE